jgi:WD40 repeat protein
VIVSGTWDGAVQAWDLIQRIPLRDRASGHDDAVRAVALGELNGNPAVVSGGEDGTVRVSELTQDTSTSGGHGHARHVHYPRAVAVGELSGRPVVVSGGWDGTLQVWDLADGTPIGDPLVGHVQNSYGSSDVRAVAVGRLGGRPVAVSGGADGTVRVWDLTRGTPIGDPLTHDEDYDSYSDVRAVTLGTWEGSPVIVSIFGSTVRVWDLARQTPIGEPIPGPALGVPRYGLQGIYALAVGYRSGRAVIVSGSATGTVRVSDLALGTPVGDPLISEQYDALGTQIGISAIAVGDWAGRQVVVAGYGETVRIWDLEDGTPVGDPFTGHKVSALAVAESAGNPAIVSSGYDGTVRLWDATSNQKKIVEVGASINSLALTPTGKCVLSCSMGVVVLDLKLSQPLSHAVPPAPV